jgi:hypothetical protein
MEQIIPLLKVLLWPALIVFLVILFREPFKNLLNRATNLTVKIPGGGEVTVSGEKARDIAESVLKEVDELIEGMTPKESGELRKFAAATGPLELCKDVEREFVRHSTYHKEILRDLRRRHLIRPLESGPWDCGKHIEITPFGRLVLNIRGKEIERKASKLTTV